MPVNAGIPGTMAFAVLPGARGLALGTASLADHRHD